MSSCHGRVVAVERLLRNVLLWLLVMVVVGSCRYLLGAWSLGLGNGRKLGRSSGQSNGRCCYWYGGWQFAGIKGFCGNLLVVVNRCQNGLSLGRCRCWVVVAGQVSIVGRMRGLAVKVESSVAPRLITVHDNCRLSKPFNEMGDKDGVRCERHVEDPVELRRPGASGPEILGKGRRN